MIAVIFGLRRCLLARVGAVPVILTFLVLTLSTPFTSLARQFFFVDKIRFFLLLLTV